VGGIACVADVFSAGRIWWVGVEKEEGGRAARGVGGSGKPVPEGATPATRRHGEAASSGPLVTLSLLTRAPVK